MNDETRTFTSSQNDQILKYIDNFLESNGLEVQDICYILRGKVENQERSNDISSVNDNIVQKIYTQTKVTSIKRKAKEIWAHLSMLYPDRGYKTIHQHVNRLLVKRHHHDKQKTGTVVGKGDEKSDFQAVEISSPNNTKTLTKQRKRTGKFLEEEDHRLLSNLRIIQNCHENTPIEYIPDKQVPWVLVAAVMNNERTNKDYMRRWSRLKHRLIHGDAHDKRLKGNRLKRKSATYGNEIIPITTEVALSSSSVSSVANYDASKATTFDEQGYIIFKYIYDLSISLSSSSSSSSFVSKDILWSQIDRKLSLPPQTAIRRFKSFMSAFIDSADKNKSLVEQLSKVYGRIKDLGLQKARIVPPSNFGRIPSSTTSPSKSKRAIANSSYRRGTRVVSSVIDSNDSNIIGGNSNRNDSESSIEINNNDHLLPISLGEMNYGSPAVTVTTGAGGAGVGMTDEFSDPNDQIASISGIKEFTDMDGIGSSVGRVENVGVKLAEMHPQTRPYESSLTISDATSLIVPEYDHQLYHHNDRPLQQRYMYQHGNPSLPLMHQIVQYHDTHYIPYPFAALSQPLQNDYEEPLHLMERVYSVDTSTTVDNYTSLVVESSANNPSIISTATATSNTATSTTSNTAIEVTKAFSRESNANEDPELKDNSTLE